MSSYTPLWVKKDIKRFPRVHLRKAGGILETADVVSSFHTEARDTDARAFSALMRHVNEVDAAYGTVIMTQVENEVGLLGDSRDGSSAANKKFSELVPKELTEHLSSTWDSLSADLTANLQVFKNTGQMSGSWESVFGKSKQTDELFMAYDYAVYVNHVAAAGKKEYSIPLYTNAWQKYVGSDIPNRCWWRW